MTDIDSRIQQSEIRVFKAVFPNNTNHDHTLYGGAAMQMIDEVAFIAATRFSRKRMVTVSSDRINFLQPIPVGSIIELVAKVSQVRNTSMKVDVEIYVEEMYSSIRFQAVSSTLTFVALGPDGKPLNIL